MSNDIVIKVENLSKEYRLGTISHGTLYHDLQSWWARLRGKEDPNSIISIAQSAKRKASNAMPSAPGALQENPHFLALDNISFEVKQGDILGIIGRNGAGKSTLLKILSEITAPTSGVVKIKGRVASLLEIGTGFHPELTGGENIYLNGAILGMTRKEIASKFDEIVAFAEIEQFIDTPVKRYSSGMYVRLAFAVAAHLEPEILIVDEVLAVGDAAFQKKCLGKMGDVARQGRTVLFVSHNMNAIEQLCSSALLIEKGRVKKFDQDVRSVVKEYLFDKENELETMDWINSANKYDNPYFKPLQFYIGDNTGHKQKTALSNDTDFYIYVEGEIRQLDHSLQIGYAFYDEEGSLLYWSCHNDVREEDWPRLQEGHCVLRTQIPKRFLNEGMYRIELFVALYFKQWLLEPGVNAPAITLTVQGGLSDSPYWMIKRPGILAPLLRWQRL